MFIKQLKTINLAAFDICDIQEKTLTLTRSLCAGPINNKNLSPNIASIIC